MGFPVAAVAGYFQCPGADIAAALTAALGSAAVTRNLGEGVGVITVANDRIDEPSRDPATSSHLTPVIGYDPDSRQLTLTGPLYYADYVAGSNTGMIFADTPSTLIRSGLVQPSANDEAVVRFLATGATDEGDVTFFQNIRRVPAGYLLVRTEQTSSLTPVRAAPGMAAPADSTHTAVRFGEGLPGAAVVTEHDSAPIYYSSFGPLDESEDRYVVQAVTALGARGELRPVRVDADTLAADLKQLVGVYAEPVPDITAYIQYAVARAAAADGVRVLFDPAEATPSSGSRKPVNPTSLIAPGLLAKQPGSMVVADKAAVRKRIAHRLSAHFGVRVELPLVEPRTGLAVPSSARRAVGGRRPAAPLHDWLLRLKNRIYEIFHSESFVDRPWLDAQAVRIAFEGFIKGRNTDVELFWRILQVELWAREFLDEKADEAAQPSIKGVLDANEGKQLKISVENEEWIRIPIRTDLFNKGDRLDDKISIYVRDVIKHAQTESDYASGLTRGWYLLVSEKIVAIAQGRSYFIWDIQPSWWARTLSKYVVKTPYGIGLGSPWTMQLAIQEAGLPRILAASAVSAVGKLVGKRGLFYNVAGHSVRAIDGPTEYSVYPANVSAKLPPAQPDRVAAQLRNAIRNALEKDGQSEIAAALRGCVVIDANDIGRNVLGQDADRPAGFFENLFADNPLGQGSQQTPVAIAIQST